MTQRGRNCVYILLAIAALIAVIVLGIWFGSTLKILFPNPDQGSTPSSVQQIDGPPPAELSCNPQEEVNGQAIGCVNDRIGDILIGPNGETCTIVDTEGHMTCNLPDIPGTPPLPSCD